jgi:monoterpene epsilon-lactone hydrolase
LAVLTSDRLASLRCRAGLLYFHDGGFSAGSIVSHRAMVTQTGRTAQARTLAVDYRRTPEHPYPAALNDALHAYGWLLAQGVQPGRIALGGDSAGGGLALAVMVALRDRGLALPACGWCILPGRRRARRWPPRSMPI